MSRHSLSALLALLCFSGFVTKDATGQVEISLDELEPEHYRYVQAENCANCHQSGNDIMIRAVGVDISSGEVRRYERGWLASVHSRSQSHGDRVNSACAWCHAPTSPDATRDSAAAVPIETGAWEGVTCGACHPGRLEKSERESLLINFLPGSDPTEPAGYAFIDKSDPVQFNEQCRYCHHQSHDLLSPAMSGMLEGGELRCIDCHMAGYGVAKNRIVERFHNMKVEANGPISCSGRYGTEVGCHPNASTAWMETNLPSVKGPRKDW